MIIFKILGILIVLMIGYMAYKNNQTPKNLGVTNGKLAPLSNKPNCISTMTDQNDKLVDPWPVKSTTEETMTSIHKIIELYGRGKIITETDTYIHVVFSTSTMRYKDDVEFYIDTTAGLVHFRSASRIGYSDMGLNKERYNKLTTLYLEN